MAQLLHRDWFHTFKRLVTIRHIPLCNCKGTNKIGNKEELCKKNRRAIKKVPKYLELSIILRIFAPSEHLFWLSG